MNEDAADLRASLEERKYDLSITGYFRVLRRFWTYVKPYKSKFILVFLLLILSVPLTQVAIFLTRDVVNNALVASGKTVADRWAIVLRIVTIQSLFWFAGAILSTMREVLEWYTSMRSTYDLRRAFYRHLHCLPLQFLRTRPAGEHLYRSTIDFGKPDGDGYDPGVMGMITRQFSQLVEQAYSVVWGGIFLYLINPMLGYLLTLYMIPYVLVGWWSYDKVRLAYFRQRHREEYETAVLRDSVASLRTLKSMGRTQFQLRRYAHAAVRTRRRAMELLWWQTIADNAALWSVRWVFNGLLLAYTSLLVINGKLTVGDWFASTALLAAVQLPLEKFFLLVQTLRRDMVPAQRILETLDVEPELGDKPNAHELGPIQGLVEFKDVRFSYEPGKEVLHGVSFVVQPGQHVGFVGPSGAGKSSVLNLLLRLHAPDSGQICVDGFDTMDVALETLLDQTSVVPQSTYLYDDTIAGNIRFGDPRADEETFDRAVRESGVADFAARRTEGLETEIGEGATVSGGERQRIGIARALIRSPRILLLDEATANLDPHTEGDLLATLKEVSVGRTTITVAHRLKAVKSCDLIFVMENGQIVETGTHAQLVRADGLYARLWRSQAETVDEALSAPIAKEEKERRK